MEMEKIRVSVFKTVDQFSVTLSFKNSRGAWQTIITSSDIHSILGL